MKLFIPFLKLIRLPNLVFIGITQLLFYFCLLAPHIHPQVFFPDEFLLLTILSGSSILIAAGGYVINDYFDVPIDYVNKPEKMVIEKIIPRKWGIIWHWLLSTAGVVMGFFITFITGNWLIGFSHVLCVVALWLYSTTFKKRAIVGNIIISLLTAWVILIVFLFIDYFPQSVAFGWDMPAGMGEELRKRMLRLSLMYAGFAFIISLIREVIKDMEDVEGDAKYGCKTLPILWGIPVAKMFTAVWLMVLTGALTVIVFYAIYLNWWASILYCILFIIIPLIIVTRRLYLAQTSKDFGTLSRWVKWIMFAGILSMVFFRWYSAS